MERFREPTRELCRQLLRGFVERGEVDAAEEYAKQIPPRVIAEILGIDPSRGDDFAEWVRGVLELGLTDPEVREKYREIIERFFLDEIERRRAEPGDDLISYLINAELDGRPVPMHVVRGNVSLMLIAGIDTTWSSIGSALWHLAQHADDRRRLVEEPALIPIAVEEFLRAYSPVTMARIARHDTMIGDREIKEGERVLLSFPAANRDPAVFERADEVIIDREANRHVAFGVGIHRCVGSNLARMEMQVAIEEFLAMIPEFELADPDAVAWAGGQVRGPRNLPVRFSAPTCSHHRPLTAGAAGGTANADGGSPHGEVRADDRLLSRRIGMTIVEEWDRSPTDRGAVLAPAGDVANATIEVLTLGDIAVEGVAPTNVVLTLFVDDARRLCTRSAPQVWRSRVTWRTPRGDIDRSVSMIPTVCASGSSRSSTPTPALRMTQVAPWSPICRCAAATR